MPLQKDGASFTSRQWQQSGDISGGGTRRVVPEGTEGGRWAGPAVELVVWGRDVNAAPGRQLRAPGTEEGRLQGREGPDTLVQGPGQPKGSCTSQFVKGVDLPLNVLTERQREEGRTLSV